MFRLNDHIAHSVRTRGSVAVWEIAGAAVAAPYLVASAWSSSPHAMALALAFSLGVLAILRDAVSRVIVAPFSSPTEQDVERSAEAASQPPATMSGLPGRDALEKAIEAYDPAPGAKTLGLIRFVNYRAMVAFNPTAATGVMQEFGRRLKAAAGEDRHATQLDDDTFAILLDEGSDIASPESELASLAYVLAQEIESGEITVLPDIHVSEPRPDPSLATLSADLGAAYAALAPLRQLKQAKNVRKPAPENLADRFAIEQALRRAVRDGQLSLRYQPFVDLGVGQVIGAEALLRWRHPELGDVSPARFVPLLEETGLVHEIGLWTLNSACRQLREWHQAGDRQLRLAINLSAIQLQNVSLQSLIERTVAAHGLAPSDIELELTETAAMEDAKRTARLFRVLRANGFGIAIDDFGNGHSNLSYLKNLPFTKLKIDREFVTHVDTRPGSQAICKALVQLGEGLGISVLAEGVERHEEVTTLRRLGCQVFQGFYFAKPLTPSELTSRLGDSEWLSLLGSDVRRGQVELHRRIVS